MEYGKWELVKRGGGNVYALCEGPRALDAALAAADKIDITVVNCRFVKPLDTELLNGINKRGVKIVTLEDNIRHGGFGESVLSYLNMSKLNATVAVLAHPDGFIDDRDIASSLESSGLTSENLILTVKSLE
ncbi:MAG: hypothetical protein K2M48_00860 [Clostridiales bacterium]|nr:hypothetical protein [Clostridiales bacterium]